MKLYRGGFGIHEYFTAANDEENAIKNIQKIDGMAALPVEAQEITVEGYNIKVTPVKGDK